MCKAYTLQGWLKGLNSSALSTASPNTADFSTQDMGLDGKSGNTQDFARNKNVSRDVVGFTLGYYYGDYRKVRAGTSDNFELIYAANADFNTASSSLFNGNIRHAVYTIARLNELDGYAQPEGFSYKYDQLNRLLSQRERINYTLGTTYAWLAAAGVRSHFREDISYDPNGNILSYNRAGNNAAQFSMDNLTYTYQPNTNKLTQIDDAQTNQGAYIGDLEDQAADNYSYDAIGNLTKDTRDSVSFITWTNAQKINSINKTDRSISFKYDPMQNRVAKYSKPNNSNLETRTYYIRDAQGNVMATYAGYVKNTGSITWDSLRLTEQHIYGSARVGAALTNVKLYPQVPKNPHLPDTSHYPIFEGWKHYEISNHLGNVLAVITDRKRCGNTTGTDILWFDADVVSSQQYYPFGMLLPGDANSANLRRQYTNPNSFDKDYRYGFNGKEGDDEVKGDDNQQDYGMRIYDPRVAKFLSVDPIAREYPELTPYQFASNTPIQAIDLDGLEMVFSADGIYLGKWGKSTEIRIFASHEIEQIKTVRDNLKCKKCKHEWLLSRTERAYVPGFVSEKEIFLGWALKYQPKIRDHETTMSVFEKTLTDKSGKEFKVMIPGTTVDGPQKFRTGGAEINLFGSKAILEGLDLEKEFGWKRTMAIHTHHRGGQTRLSNDFGTLGGYEGDIPTGVYNNLKILLVTYEGRFIQEFDPSIYNKKNPNGMKVGSRFEHDEAAKAATNENYIFIER